VLAEHEGWNERVLLLIRAIPQDRFYNWSLFDSDPLPRWRQGRITLLGDDAHPMLPFHGMGGAMAFEDAIVLARCLSDYRDPEQALDRYEALREPRTRAVMLSSRAHGARLQASGPDRSTWHERIRSQGNDAEPQSDWHFFDYNPATVAV
ncbi:MAG: FAD-dependent monooxygenase, partial [Pseudomonadota bacterium]